MAHPRTTPAPTPQTGVGGPKGPGARGHAAAGPGFYVWYPTRAEAESWRRELALDERPPRPRRRAERGAREAPSASP